MNELLEYTKWRQLIEGTMSTYVAVWEAAVGQILPCQREGGNIHDPYMYAVTVVENNDTSIDNDAPTLKTFRDKELSPIAPETAQFAKDITHEGLPLSGMLSFRMNLNPNSQLVSHLTKTLSHLTKTLGHGR